MKKIFILIVSLLLINVSLNAKSIDKMFSQYLNINDNNKNYTVDDYRKDYHNKLVSENAIRNIITKQKKVVEIKNFVDEKSGIIDTLNKLIKQRKYKSAYDMFNNISIDFSEQDYKDYNYFLNITSNLHNNNIDVSGVKYMSIDKTKKLLKEFYLSMTEGKITDKNYVVKLLEIIQNSNLKLDDKFRNKMKIYTFSGEFTNSLKNGLSIKQKTKKDKKFISNVLNTLEEIQQRYFKEYLKTNYKDWSIKSLKKI